MKIRLGAMLAVAALFPAAAPAQDAPPVQIVSKEVRAADAVAVRNMIGRYAAYVMAGDSDRIVAMLALDQPDVRLNVPYPMQGADAVRAHFAALKRTPRTPGELHWQPVLSPVIEVAGDGRTAKGIWDVIAIDTYGPGTGVNWIFCVLSVDFIKIDGQWKIWHLIHKAIADSPYEKPFNLIAKERQAAKAANPDQPFTTDDKNPLVGRLPIENPKLEPRGPGADQIRRFSVTDYTGRARRLLEPVPPRPYTTFEPYDAFR